MYDPVPMAPGKRDETALGTARARFIDGLPRKAKELKGAVALLSAGPDEVRPREELRRRLHALYASAQVFRLHALADALKENIAHLDRARDEDRGLTQDELDVLAQLASVLPALASQQQRGRASTESGTPPAAVSTPGAPAGVRGAASSAGAIEAPAVAGSAVAQPLPPPPRVPSARPSFKATTLQGLPPQRADGAEPASDTPSVRPRAPRRPSGGFAPSRLASERPGAPSEAPFATVVSVLVVDSVEWQGRLEAMLPADRFEVLSASDPEAALGLARTAAPDVVVADRGVLDRHDVDFVGRLRGDPLTDFMPLVVLLPETDRASVTSDEVAYADVVLHKPVDAAALERAIGRLTGTLTSGGLPIDALGHLTPSELFDRLSQELRRGLLSSVAQGRETRVALGDGSDIMAALWSAVARVRAIVAEKSDGRVRFRDKPRQGGPAVLALIDDGDEGGGDAEQVSLAGRRIIVADDDPAVVWFFAGVLRESGADVIEAGDGAEALAESRRRRPDVIISDILMPGLDGFGLCRELKRDPVLAEVPVILLSWKEDYLERMRELRAGASGYLRKEAGSAQILNRVRAVLRPRARIEAQLRAGGEVRGRLDDVGMAILLRTVADAWPDARVSARDAWNLLEIDLRKGRIVQVTRTAADGSFARGERVLGQLLGVDSGRFVAVETDAPVRGTLTATTDETLFEASTRLGAVLDAVSGVGLLEAAVLDLEPEAIDAYLRTSPSPIRGLVERLREADSPRQLLLEKHIAPELLESLLVDLARRGVIAAVRGPAGEDRIATALARRRGTISEATTPGELPAPSSEVAFDEPAPPDAAGKALPAQDERSAPRVEELDGGPSGGASAVAPPAPPATEGSAPPAEGGRPPAQSVVDLDAPFSGADDELPHGAPGADHGSASFDDLSEPFGASAVEARFTPLPPRGPDAAPARGADRVEAIDRAAPDEATPPSGPGSSPAATAASEPVASAVAAAHASAELEAAAPSAAPSESVGPATSPSPGAGDAAMVSGGHARAGHAVPPPPPSQAPADDRLVRYVGWPLLLLLFAAVGYVGVRLIEQSRWQGAAQDNGGEQPSEGRGEDEPAREVSPNRDAGTRDSATPSSPLGVVGRSADTLAGVLRPFGETLPYVVDAGVRVDADEGLLWLDGQADDPTVMAIGGTDLGRAPTFVALTAGRHRLDFRRGNRRSVRYINIRVGQTERVAAPQ